MSECQLLVAEPDQMDCQRFAAALESSRYNVGEFVGGGAPLLQQFDPTRHDVVVINLEASLQDVDGISEGMPDFINIFTSEHPDARLLITYSVDTKFMVRKAMNAGAIGKIKKPYDRFSILESLVRVESRQQNKDPLLGNELSLKKRAPLSYKKNPDGLLSFLSSRTSVLSSHLCPKGVRFMPEETLKREDPLALELELPCFDTPLKCRGVVRDAHEKQGVDLTPVDVRFQNPGEEKQRDLKEYILREKSSD